ncbi:MAG: hypothetical protein K0S14_1300 [Thermomicrobiales bacterium]|jgi:hypothetical protein|nr:hypothetical protein [Thermomicrobiales bacterium]MCD6058102.1 hypothetical protein [Thermomicrobiales bacterium]MDF3016430.1 hypothetical protein [Thermomicrobiales bacterium]
MDVKRLDQVARKLIANVPRREAVKTLAGGLSATLAARFGAAEVAAGDCRKRGRSCTRGGQCCNGKRTACRKFPTDTCSELSGRRCCGLEGAPCRNDARYNHCDCCDGLYCGGVTGTGRCQEEPS